VEEGKELIGDHDRANGISCQDVTETPIWRALCARLADAGVVDKDVESVVEVSNLVGCFVDWLFGCDVELDSFDAAFEIRERRNCRGSLVAVVERAAAEEDVVGRGGEDEVPGTFVSNALIGS